MANRVACGYDGSPESMAALRLGASIARTLGCELVVLHADAASSAGLDSERGDLRQRLAAQWRERFDRLAKAVDRDVTLRSEPGDPAMWLLSLAAEESCECVVLGSRGRGGAGAAMLGSVSRRVAAEAAAPVVIVSPEAAVDPGLDVLAGAPIVCGVDGSDEGNAAVGAAARLAAGAGGSLILVNVREDAETMLGSQEPGDFDARLSADARTRLALLHRAYDPYRESVDLRVELLKCPEERSAEALRWLAAEEGASLIAVGSRGRGAIRSAVLGSTSADLACSASQPVLVVPPAAAARVGDRS